jgi:Divergent CRAL/TRIO domain
MPNIVPVLFSLAGAIIRLASYVIHRPFPTQFIFSPKFFRKLTYVPTLSDLAHHVPLTQIDIPPAVYRCVQLFIYDALLTLQIAEKT